MNVYLTSNLEWAAPNLPNGLTGVVPNSFGKTDDAISAAIIVNDRGAGNVVRILHVLLCLQHGENCPIPRTRQSYRRLGAATRFGSKTASRRRSGTASTGNGEAFHYSGGETGYRPVTYSARRRINARKGTHDHTIPDLNPPIGPLQDYTSQGTLWDLRSAPYPHLRRRHLSSLVLRRRWQ